MFHALRFAPTASVLAFAFGCSAGTASDPVAVEPPIQPSAPLAGAGSEGNAPLGPPGNGLAGTALGAGTAPASETTSAAPSGTSALAVTADNLAAQSIELSGSSPVPEGSTSGSAGGGTAGLASSQEHGSAGSGNSPEGNPPRAQGGAGGIAGAAGGSGGEGTEDPAGGGVSFSAPSQSFKDELEVEVTTVGQGEIRYSTDGTRPTASSTLYAGPLTLTATTQLRAQAFVEGEPSGAVSSALYIARTFDVTSTLPLLLLDGYGAGESTDKKLFLDAAVMVFEPVAGTASLSNLPTLVTRAGYHLRGQSSATFEQRPYRVEFWDELNDDADLPLLGMPADSDWALIPPFYDRSLIRNPFTYTLGKDLGLQAPNTAFAEVYVNYEARALSDTDYQGIYWVSELIKDSKSRTNLKKLEEEDTTLPKISGGYIWKFEQFAAEEPTLSCTGSEPIAGSFGGGIGAGAPAASGTCWHSLEVVDPSPLNTEQQIWLTQYIQEFHDALHAAPIGDYGAYIDMASFVDYFLLTELSRNMDAYVRSAYYFKEREGKIQAGPLWDYNFAYGAGSPEVIDPAGEWQVNSGRNVNDWYLKLLADPAFRAAVKARWQVVRLDQFSLESISERIDTVSEPLLDATSRDAAKWPMSFFIDRAGRSMVPIEFPTAETFEGQLQALRDYLSARLSRMDTLIDEL